MAPILRCGNLLHALGFNVINVHKRSKHPVGKNWNKGPRKDWKTVCKEHLTGMNMGACMGETSIIGDKYAAAIDCDLKSDDPRHKTEMEGKLRELLPSYNQAPATASGRGNGSCHIWCLTSTPAASYTFAQSKEVVKVKMPSAEPNKKEKDQLSEEEIKLGYRLRCAWEISIIGNGKQIVLPYSVHPDTGLKYKWLRPIQTISDLPILPKKSAPKKIEGADSAMTDYIKPSSWEKLNLDQFPLSPSTIAKIKDGVGVVDRSAALYGVAIEMYQAGMSDDEIVNVLTDQDYFLGGTAYSHANTKNRTKAAKWLIRFTLNKAKAVEKQNRENLFSDINVETNKILTSMPEIHTDALYGVAGEFINLVKDETEADIPNLLLQFLSAIGNLFGRSSYFVVGSDRHHTNIFVGIIGNSSKARKGSALSIVENEVCKHLDPDWYKKCKISGLSSGEGIINALRDEAEKTNSKGKVYIVAGVEDKRILAIESELARILRSLERTGNTLSPIVRDAWDGRTLQSLVKGDPQRATNPHVSIISHITQEELNNNLSLNEIANGFANRFIWVFVQRSKLLPSGGNIQNLDFTSIVEAVKEARDFAANNLQIRFSPKAYVLWEKNYLNLSQEMGGLVGKLTARSEAHVLRLALIYALLDCSNNIKTHHLKAALAVWDYSVKSCEYIWGSHSSTDEKKILNALENQDAISRTDITAKIFQRNKDKNNIQRSLNTLLSKGRIETYTENGKEMWRLAQLTTNPQAGK